MHKPPYEIQESSKAFFGNRSYGGIHNISRRYDSSIHDTTEDFTKYSFYDHVGRSVKTLKEVERLDASLVRPEEYFPILYKRQEYSIPKPTRESVDAFLQEEAKNAIKFSLFSSIEKKRQLYVIERQESRLVAEQNNWLSEKEAFDKKQEEKENAYNALQLEKQQQALCNINEYEKCHRSNEQFLHSTTEEIEALLQQLDPHFPYDFKLTYQVDLAHNLVNICFDAPSKRIIPLDDKVFHSRGFTIKPKTQTEINREYLECVCGLGYVIAAQCFNITAKIDSVFISAYSRELNPQNATFDKNALYAIVFDRDTFNWVILPNSFQPHESIVFFPHAINLGARLNIMPINPLNLSPAGEKLPGGNPFVDTSHSDNRPSYVGAFFTGNEKPIRIDEQFEEAARVIVTSQRGLASELQRKLGMGYSRAGKVMDQLEAAGIVGPQSSFRSRDVLVKDLNQLDILLNQFYEINR